MNRAQLLFWVSVWCGLALAGDAAFKKERIWVGVLAYATASIPAVFCLRCREYGNIVVVWSAVSVVLGILVAIAAFSEPFTARKVIGTALAIAAILIAG